MKKKIKNLFIIFSFVDSMKAIVFSEISFIDSMKEICFCTFHRYNLCTIFSFHSLKISDFRAANGDGLT